MTEATNIIDLRQITVDFYHKQHKITAVKQVDLQIQQGDIYGIVGYSGAGKSTLVRVINLLQRPTTGQVVVNQQELMKLSAPNLRQARKKIGMIFQQFNLLEARTVFSNVEIALLDSHLTTEEKKQKVDELLKLVGLADKANNYPSQLSGGQKQRVAIARALANDPQILISDEATSALDPETTTEILNLLKYLNQTLQITIVVITHEMDVIKQICRNLAVMDAGSIVEQGSVLKLFSQPQTQVAQQFVNSATRVAAALQEIKAAGLAKNLLQLNYVGDVTDEPIVVKLSQQFNLQANILFGNIEQLQGTTVGVMLIELSGDEKNLQAALAYLEKLDVKVKQIQVEVDECK